MAHAHPKISLNQARALALRAQGLDRPAAFGSGLEGVLNAVEHLGYIQIDTISVVQRAHHHVLWSRVPDYEIAHLDALHIDRKVYEYWGHAASYLPIKNFRQSLPKMKSYRNKTHWAEDSPELRLAMKRVLKRIRNEGPLKARDFEESNPPAERGVWSFHKIEKRALHELWMRGTVMISGRDGFQKSYDLTDRVLPAETDLSTPTQNQWADFHIQQALQAHGILREAEMRYLRSGADSAVLRKQLAVAVKKGRVIPLHVNDISKLAYVSAENLDSLTETMEPTEVSILSPFDNLVIQRERLRWLFNFDYQIECYVPEAKRRYGHFVLPVLWGDQFAARLEVKRQTKESRLVLIGLWFESGYDRNHSFKSALGNSLEEFAHFNGCESLDDRLLKR